MKGDTKKVLLTQSPKPHNHHLLPPQFGGNHHYMPFKNGFTIKHYAGDVSYHIDGFCEKNRDVLNVDIIEVRGIS